MYMKINRTHIHDLDTTILSKIETQLNAKNMNLDDVEPVLSVELKDENIPSRTLLDFTKFIKTKKQSTIDMFKNDLSDIVKNASSTGAVKNQIDDTQKKLSTIQDDTNKESIEHFKKMLEDKDNVLQIIIKHDFIVINETVPVTDYNLLPDSIKSLIISNQLKY